MLKKHLMMKTLVTVGLGIVVSAACFAETTPQRGRVVTIGDDHRIYATSKITGDAAKILYEVISVRTRLQYLADDLRLMQGRDMDCYEHGLPAGEDSVFTYSCEFKMLEGGDVVRISP